MEEVALKDVSPKEILSKLSFDDPKCPLFISQNGNATALYRYSNSGPFVELYDPLSTNLLPALKCSIIQGNFCIFNFGRIENVQDASQMLKTLHQSCTKIHPDLYNHIIQNTLMKQPFDTFMSLIPFDPTYEMVPEIYRNSKATFRFLFFIQIEDPSMELPTEVASLFHCIRVKP